MLEFLKKFNSLPAGLKDKVSSPEAMAKIGALEKKYNYSLAALIMRVMIKEVALSELAAYLRRENLAAEPAEALARELKEQIFAPLADYLAPAVKNLEPTKEARPRPEAPAVKGASFFFSPDDEEEIRRLAGKISAGGNMSAAALEEKIEAVIVRTRINFGSVELADRFKQILKTYFRGIRNRLEAKSTFIKPFLNGGLSFDADSAEQVMVLADKIINGKAAADLRPLPEIKLPQPEKIAIKPELARDAAYDFSALAKKAAPPPSAAIKTAIKKLDVSHELAPLPPVPLAVKAEIKSQPELKKKITPPLRPSSGEASQTPLIRRRFQAENLSQSPKMKMADVKYVPKVMGPLDELRYADLISFRRLDKNPDSAAVKIKDKINLLAEEDYAQKLEGVKYWRQSPLHKLYLEIGNKSISENKPIDVIIEARRAGGQEALTADEFKAIMDLNKSLRF